MKKTKETGITLIALIITVIVMIILAFVTTNLFIGDNGIFRKSEEGSQIYKNVANEEVNDLNQVDSQLQNLINDLKRKEIDDQGTVKFGEIVWKNEKANITMSTTTNYMIQYQINSEVEENWIEGTIANDLNLNDILYARLHNGTMGGNSVKIKVIDTELPEEASISLSKTNTTIGAAVIATITHNDNQSGINIGECAWVLTTQKEEIGTEKEKYIGGTFSSKTEEIEIIAPTEGIYYLHILTIDNASNPKETISREGIKVIEPQGKPDENGIYTENSTINGEEGNAFNPEIPKGFKPVDVGEAQWGTEESYKKGLVIQDVRGNQFVWVPCDGEVLKLERWTVGNKGTWDRLGDGAWYAYNDVDSAPNGNAICRDLAGFKNSVKEHRRILFCTI